MDISPQQVRTAEFRSAKRGLDPDEVRGFLAEVAAELERAQNQSTAMEARARAAVARLQELSDGRAAPVATSEPPVEAPPAAEPVSPSVDESETISRTLLLAQRTADMTVAEAEAHAERISREAGDEATKTLDSMRETSERLLMEARDAAQREGESERVTVRAEVESLKARRDFLESDVDHLERHLADERSRLREAATSLLELTERVPGGLGDVRRPLLSAADDTEPSEDSESSDGPDDDADRIDPAPNAIEMSDSASSDDDGLFIQTELDDDGPGTTADGDAKRADFDD